MVLFLLATAHAGLENATLDVPAPVVTDLDLMPDPGAWPCKLDFKVSGAGQVTDLGVDGNCPSGLRSTAGQIAKGVTFAPAGGDHAEGATVVFRVIGSDAPEPKPESRLDRLVFLLRPLDVLPAPPTTAEAPTAPLRLDKPPRPKMPRAAAALHLTGGTCTVRVEVGADGKVTRARANRCLDVLAPDAVAGATKLKFEVAEGNTSAGEFDVPVRFEAKR